MKRVSDGINESNYGISLPGKISSRKSPGIKKRVKISVSSMD
jgi:hypothetical protein